MSENGTASRTLDLDALFGVQEPLTFTWQARTYELLRPQALGPREIVQLETLQRRVNALSAMQGADNLTSEQAAEVTRLYRDMLYLVCPAMRDEKDDGSEMPFMAMARVLNWYKEETQLPETEKKK